MNIYKYSLGLLVVTLLVSFTLKNHFKPKDLPAHSETIDNPVFRHMDGIIQDPEFNLPEPGTGGRPQFGFVRLRHPYQGIQVLQFLNTRNLDSLQNGDSVGFLVDTQRIQGIDLPLAIDLCYPSTCH